MKKHMNIFKTSYSVILIALVLIVSYMIAIGTSTAMAEDSQEQEGNSYAINIEDLQGYDFPDYEGKANLKEWFDDIILERGKYVGRTDMYIAEHGNFADEEQLAILYEYEDVLTSARSFAQYYEYQDKYETLVSELLSAFNEAKSQPAQSYGSSGYAPDGNGFKYQGVVYQNGTRYTYYSSNVLYHYRTSEWSSDGQGFYRDSDGYYVVASDDYPQGSVVSTPWGDGKVYDCGAGSGTIDMYVSF